MSIVEITVEYRCESGKIITTKRAVTYAQFAQTLLEPPHIITELRQIIADTFEMGYQEDGE